MRKLLFTATTALFSTSCAATSCPDSLVRSAPHETAPPVVPNSTPQGPRVSTTVRPNPMQGTADVEIVAAAEPERLARFSISADNLASIHLGELEDTQGTMSATPALASDGRVTLTLPRVPSGEVRLNYTIDGKSRPWSALPAVDADPNRLQATGEALLFLPDGLDDHRVHATITLDTKGHEADAGVELRCRQDTRDRPARGRAASRFLCDW